jgi:hypothetical protein
MRRILVLYAYPPGKGEMRLAVAQHLHALDGLGDDVVYVNAHDGSPSWLRHQVFDAVVLHTTFLWYRTRKKHRRAWTWLRELDCRKVALPQDEYYLAHVLDDWLLELGVDHVFSVFEEPLRSMIYPRLSGRATFSTALTGYIDEETAAYCRHRHRPLAERPLDIGYRTRPPRFWLGRHGLLKPGIGAAVLERAGTHALKADISTRPEDTIYGTAWLDFLLASRATIGVEGGSSVLDRRGEVYRRVRELLKAQPSLTFEQVDAAMPVGWDSYAFFAIGPRHLEAVVTRTAQVLVEGRYSGVLEPERHYIPVKRDFSDLDDALERLHDLDCLEELTTRAYEEVYLAGRWTLREFGNQLRDALAVRHRPRIRKHLRSTIRVLASPRRRGDRNGQSA